MEDGLKEIVIDGRRRMEQALNTLASIVSSGHFAERIVKVPQSRYEPHQGAREMERRRKQRVRAGLPVVEPPPIDLAACAGIDEEGGA